MDASFYRILVVLLLSYSTLSLDSNETTTTTDGPLPCQKQVPSLLPIIPVSNHVDLPLPSPTTPDRTTNQIPLYRSPQDVPAQPRHQQQFDNQQPNGFQQQQDQQQENNIVRPILCDYLFT